MIDPDNPLVRVGRKMVAEGQFVGPGRHAVIWVQGCRRRCNGCFAPDFWDFAGGETIDVAALALWVEQQTDIDGVTLSGGEPFDQAAALAALCTRVKATRNLGIVAYTGNTLETLQRRGTLAQRALVAHVDLLIDGPYERERHADLLWRASANQRLLALTPRYRPQIEALTPATDCSSPAPSTG